MKKIIVLLFSLFSVYVYGQKLPDYGFDKVRISDSTKTVLAEIMPVSSAPAIKSNLYYFWYSANKIHSTQGGYSGKLLNGRYTEYYLNKNLREQGSFKKGLKEGLWKSWNEDGKLMHETYWKNGITVIYKRSSFWKKLNIFKRKQKWPSPDSTGRQ
jgi:antitoxin component YwqK of YwqJK toxin-antitoxin module